jgi:hypothetical protein
MNLPSYPSLGVDDIKYISGKINEFVKGNKDGSY